MQVITHLPMMAITLPSGVYLFYKDLVKVMKMDLLEIVGIKDEFMAILGIEVSEETSELV